MPQKRIQIQQGVLLVVDALMILSAFMLAYSARFTEFNTFFFISPVKVVFLWGSYLLSFFIFDLYELSIRFNSTRFLARLLVAVIFAAAFNMIVSYAAPYWKV